ncbi:AAA family ATPase [Candidatus Woesearchaeota archaeon]|nr:AAA family ATPase [Candidatus Woesearchaeota archaeon]
MKLLSISIKNYRSLKSTPKIRIDNLSVFIGENNSGKSNLINAIKIALKNENVQVGDFYKKDKDILIEFEIKNFKAEEKEVFQDFLNIHDGEEFLNLRIKISNIKEEDGTYTPNKPILQVQTKIPHDPLLKSVIENSSDRNLARQVKEDGRFNDLIEDTSSFLKEDAIKVVRRYIKTKLSEGEYDLDYVDFPLARQLYDLMPKFLFIPAVKGADEELKGGKDSTFNSILNDIFNTICSDEKCSKEVGEDRRKRDKIQKLCRTIQSYFNNQTDKLNVIKKLEKDLSDSLSEHICKTKVNFDFSTPSFEDILSLPDTFIDDGCKTTVERKGHGLQRALILAILKLYVNYLKEGQEGEHFFIGIEEPEIYLHPHSQRKMFDILKSLSSSNQVFITTHSAVLVNKMSNPENIIKLSKIDKESLIKQLKKDYFIPDELFKIEKNLTAGNSEMFFSRKTIFVEGDTEKFALPLFAKKLGIDFDEKGISVVSTGSGNNFEPFLKLVIEDGFNIPHLIMCDGDKLDLIIRLFNRLNITNEGDYAGKSESEKRDFLKTKNCFVLEDDFETTIAKNVDLEIILTCLSELKGKSITEEDIESLKKSPEDSKNNLKNMFNFITKKMGIKANYKAIEDKYKELIEELYGKAKREDQFETDESYFEELLATYMKKQNKPKLGKKLGEKLDMGVIPPQIKEIITKLSK